MLVRHIVVFILICTLNTHAVFGQDIHYSQFFYHYPSQSPVQTGLFNGDHRITANYRNQWQSVIVPYLSLSLFYDTKFTFRAGDDYIGVGLGIDYDRAGDSELSLSSLNVSLNYGMNFKKHHRVIIGLSPNVGQRRLSNEKLKWNNQWDGEEFNKNLPPRENFKLSGDFFMDLAGGIAYQYTKTKRTKFLLGGSLFHILEPNQTFYGISQNKVSLPMRFVYNANLDIGIGDRLDLILNAQYQEQEEYNEKLALGMFRIYLNQNPGIKLNLLTGFGIRLDDALIPVIGIEYKDWLISGSYDINTSDFKTATNRRGGLELAVQYHFRSVERVGVFKKCPIY
jgi:type IX secretion system PorP/SprF family membrane protein